MEIILLQDVRNLGEADDIVKVKPGYARNYLIPQGYGVMATDSNRKSIEEKKRQASHKQTFIQEQAQALADRIEGHSIIIETLAGTDGKLFGSVTALQIANKLKEIGFDIDRKVINVEDIRSTGEYVAEVKLHKKVRAKVTVHVIQEGEEVPTKTEEEETAEPVTEAEIVTETEGNEEE